ARHTASGTRVVSLRLPPCSKPDAASSNLNAVDCAPRAPRPATDLGLGPPGRSARPSAAHVGRDSGSEALPCRSVTTFAVKFLGCKVSQADAMLARRALLDAGHVEAAQADAELHVINTCCITSEAESKSRQSVRRSLATARAVHVAGCAVNL